MQSTKQLKGWEGRGEDRRGKGSSFATPCPRLRLLKLPPPHSLLHLEGKSKVRREAGQTGEGEMPSEEQGRQPFTRKKLDCAPGPAGRTSPGVSALTLEAGSLWPLPGRLEQSVSSSPPPTLPVSSGCPSPPGLFSQGLCNVVPATCGPRGFPRTPEGGTGPHPPFHCRFALPW